MIDNDKFKISWEEYQKRLMSIIGNALAGLEVSKFHFEDERMNKMTYLELCKVLSESRDDPKAYRIMKEHIFGLKSFLKPIREELVSVQPLLNETMEGILSAYVDMDEELKNSYLRNQELEQTIESLRRDIVERDLTAKEKHAQHLLIEEKLKNVGIRIRLLEQDNKSKQALIDELTKKKTPKEKKKEESEEVADTDEVFSSE